MKLYKIAYRNISRNKRRSILSGLAITIAAMAIVFLFGLIGGMLGDMRENIWTYMSGAVRVRNAGFDKYERLNPLHLSLENYQSLVKVLEEDPGVTAVSPRINFPGRIYLDDEQYVITGQGLDLEREKLYQDFSRALLEGELPRPGEREAAIGYQLAEKLDLGLGGKITILTSTASRGSKAMTFTITGLLRYTLPGLNKLQVLVSLETAQRFLWMPGQVQEILLKVDPKGESPQDVARRLQTTLPPVSQDELSILSWKEVNGMASYMDLAGTIYDIMAFVFFLLASTVIINTTIMVIFERMREIGTLAAMGMKGRALVKLFFLEALMISIMGAFFGVLFGTLINGLLSINGFSFQAMENLDNVGISSVIYPVVNLKSTVVVFFYSVLVSLAATWWPARRAAKITPMEALRYV